MTTRENFARNLHYLSAHYRSVADVCRRIDINRQQYNKYLSGANMPSMHNLKRIVDFFGVDEDEMSLPHDAFVRLVMHRPVALDLPEPLRQFFHRSRQSLDKSLSAMERYCGLYHACFHSPAWPNGIVRSLYAISQDERLSYVKSVERLAWRHKPGQVAYAHKYQGLAILDANRLYLFECQPLLRNLFSMTVLYPSNRSRISTLNGIVNSVTGGASRKPFASRVVFERLADQDDFRAALSGCGVYPIDSDDIDQDIKDRIDNSVFKPGDVLTAADI